MCGICCYLFRAHTAQRPARRRKRALDAAPPAPPESRRCGASRATMVKYSVLLPTYNERENLPLVVFMLDAVFRKE